MDLSRYEPGRKTAWAGAAFAALVAMLSAILLVLLPSSAEAEATVIPLGTAASFGVLAGQSVNNTGASFIAGDLGVSPGTAITGFPPGAVGGAQHSADAVALQAQSDLTTAYNNAPLMPVKPTTGPQIWRALTLVLLVGSAGLFTIGLWPAAYPAAPQAGALPLSSTTEVAAPLPTTAVAGPSQATAAAAAPGAPPTAREGPLVPVELRIPAIGVAVPVSELGLNADNTVEVPTDFAKPGWFRLGTAPGQEGSAVILGHVDSYRGPAVFFHLRSLQVGDAVQVTLADGAIAHFAVTSVTMYPKDRFPAQEVYAAHDGGAILNLVSCGGEFDRIAHSYRSNVVVRTSLVGVAPQQRARRLS
jgi:sortase (surface protein transpeptidase)